MACMLPDISLPRSDFFSLPSKLFSVSTKGTDLFRVGEASAVPKILEF